MHPETRVSILEGADSSVAWCLYSGMLKLFGAWGSLLRFVKIGYQNPVLRLKSCEPGAHLLHLPRSAPTPSWESHTYLQ